MHAPPHAAAAASELVARVYADHHDDLVAFLCARTGACPDEPEGQPSPVCAGQDAVEGTGGSSPPVHDPAPS